MSKRYFVLFVLCLSLNVYVFAQQDTTEADDSPRLILDFPVFDFPFQIHAMNAVRYGFFGSYTNPSMAQSLAFAQNVNTAFHFGMRQFRNTNVLGERWTRNFYFGGLAVGQFLLLWMPGGTSWLHEEFHRAKFARFEEWSSNPVNRFPFGQLVLPLDFDPDSIDRILNESRPDVARMYAAGMEGDYALINRLQRNNFFHNKQLTHEFVYWWSTVTIHGYLASDFVADFFGWAFFLFNIDETIELEEGEYLTFDHLTPQAYRFLRLQSRLHFLNYLSPMMFGIRRIPLGDTGFHMNFAMRHLLTSFGYNISATVFLKRSPFNMIFTMHNFMNYSSYFPAIEAELIDFPVNLGNQSFLLSPRVLIGVQPRNQGFRTSTPEFLGLFGLRIDHRATRNVFPYIDFTAKTNGWVAGNEFLNANVSIRMGLSLRF
ncbi:MAG: hypothetical protein LBG93_06835 [Treponema sp.]|jgi:hypothetical protein|nr:hypothetical protein [Treponema sp.]